MEPAFSLKHMVGKTSDSTLTDSSLPSSAYDYLKHVQQEAATCPDVVVADMDCSQFHTNQDTSFTALDTITSRDIQPSVQWQEEETAAFAEIRQTDDLQTRQYLKFLEQHKALAKKQKKLQKKVLPPAENQSEWFQFCFGVQYCESSKLDVQENKPYRVSNHGNSVQQVDQGTPALLSIIAQMSQVTVLAVLEHQINWLETRPFSLLQGQWIYALLAAVEKPLLADTTYSLRSLARLCARQKESLIPTQNAEMAALYLIITIVTRYFGQTDLTTASEPKQKYALNCKLTGT